MKTSLEKCLTDNIGFVTKEHFQKYKKLLEIGDILSEHSRQFDSNCGAMTFAYLSVVGDSKNNDLLSESFKFFLKKNKDSINELIKKLQEYESCL